MVNAKTLKREIRRAAKRLTRVGVHDGRLEIASQYGWLQVDVPIKLKEPVVPFSIDARQLELTGFDFSQPVTVRPHAELSHLGGEVFASHDGVETRWVTNSIQDADKPDGLPGKDPIQAAVKLDGNSPRQFRDSVKAMLRMSPASTKGSATYDYALLDVTGSSVCMVATDSYVIRKEHIIARTQPGNEHPQRLISLYELDGFEPETIEILENGIEMKGDGFRKVILEPDKTFPNYYMLFSDNRPESEATVDRDSLLERCKRAIKASKSVGEKHAKVYLEFRDDDMSVTYNYRDGDVRSSTQVSAKLLKGEPVRFAVNARYIERFLNAAPKGSEVRIGWIASRTSTRPTTWTDSTGRVTQLIMPIAH